MEQNQPNDDIDLEAKVRTFEDAARKLRKLVDQSPTFEIFKSKLESFMKFYLGDPMPEPMRTWGWAQFQQFYEENKR